MNAAQFGKQLRSEAARIGKAFKQAANGEIPLAMAVRAAKGSADLVSGLCEGFLSGEIELVNDLPPTDEGTPELSKQRGRRRTHSGSTDQNTPVAAHP